MDENDRVATIGPTLSETLRPLAVRKPEPVLRRDSHVNEIARMDTGLSNSSGGPKSPAGNGSFSSASGGLNTLRSMFDAAKVVPGRSGGDSLEGSFAKPKTSPQRGNESRNSSFARAHGKATPEVDEAPRTYVLRKPEPVPRHDSLVNEIVQMDTGLSNNSNSQKQAVGNGSFSSASGGFNALRSMFDAAKVIPSRSGGGGDSLDGSFSKPKTFPQRGNESGNSSFARAHGKSTPEGDAQTAQAKAATIQEPQLKRRGSTMSSSFERRRSSVTTSIAAGVTTFALAVSKIMDTMQNDSMNERRQAKVAELLDKEVMVLNAAQLAHIQKRRANPFTISINSSFRRWWDLVISLSVAYVIVATPIKVGFEVHSSGVIYGLDAVVDVIYLLDLCLNFFTSYEDDVTGEEIKDLVRIRKHYLTGWLAIDCLSSFPSSIIGVRNTFLTLTQVLKVTRVAKATDSGLSKAIYSRVNRSMNPSVMRMLELTMIFCVSQHFIACSYYFISLNQSMQTTWGPADEIRDSSLGQQYIDALYFAIMVTTANDVGPRTSIEKLFTSLMLFIGIVINASIIGSAANLLSNLDKEQIARKNQMDSINDYLRFKKVPLDLQNKIRRYYDYALNTRLRDPTESMFADLPDRLKLSLKLNLYSEFIHKVPLFKVCSHTGVIAIVQCLKFVVAMPGEIVICQGEFVSLLECLNLWCMISPCSCLF